MKFAAALALTAAGSATAMKTSPAVPLSVISTGTVVHKHGTELAAVSYGNPHCPCIGFDNVDGKTMVLTDRQYVDYPGDLGSRCEAWDALSHPKCKDGKASGKENAWCQSKWCYVDARKCDIDVLPQMSSFLPTARYQNMPIMYSYATCGNQDTWSKQVVDAGSYRCRCIGFNNLAGQMKFDLGAGKSALYTGDTGGSCKAWDEDQHPACAVKGPNQPAFCKQKWCFVDPCSCVVADDVPKVSGYLSNAKLQGKTVYYSYKTCGSEDYFTEEHNKGSCILKADQPSCVKDQRCGWTGKACVGKELVDKQICGLQAPGMAVVTDLIPPRAGTYVDPKKRAEIEAKGVTAPTTTLPKSSASLVKPFVAILLVPLAALFQ